MEAFVIKARLDLLVSLVDTTTGATVNERNVSFLRDGQPVRPEYRGNGTYVFINTGREDFLMQIKVYGYEEYRMKVVYEDLDSSTPAMDIFLMPSENMFSGEGLLSLSGNLPFLKKIEAVNLLRPVCFSHEYDEKKKTMTVFGSGSGRVEMADMYYGLLKTDKESYEKIEVTETVAPQSVRLKDALQGEFASNSPIMRIVFGTVSENGDYLLRVRDDGTDIRYLVRYEVNDEVRFQTVDFRNKEALV
ncbi:MAG: hypothetical protein IJP84_08350 [Lachnospiraceae bacterium]|nr:hypothetical protein [Lachnospiraceae bacterium]